MLQNALLAGANSDPKKKPKAKTLQERERGLREWMLNLEATIVGPKRFGRT